MSKRGKKKHVKRDVEKEKESKKVCRREEIQSTRLCKSRRKREWKKDKKGQSDI